MINYAIDAMEKQKLRNAGNIFVFQTGKNNFTKICLSSGISRRTLPVKIVSKLHRLSLESSGLFYFVRIEVYVLKS